MLLGTAHMIVEVFEDGPLDGIKWQFPIKGTLIIYYLLYYMRSILYIYILHVQCIIHNVQYWQVAHCSSRAVVTAPLYCHVELRRGLSAS